MSPRVSESGPTQHAEVCGAQTVFWPDDEACDAECIRPKEHPGTTHEDAVLGEWDEDDLYTRFPPLAT